MPKSPCLEKGRPLLKAASSPLQLRLQEKEERGGGDRGRRPRLTLLSPYPFFLGFPYSRANLKGPPLFIRRPARLLIAKRKAEE